jgi:4-amino-4-deoxy-L-arabinose transferase-like glycosyltransferase
MDNDARQTAQVTRLTRLDGLLLVLVLGVAIFFRFWQLDQIPPGMGYDEAFSSIQAHRIVTDPGYRPIFVASNNGVPPLKIYLTALAFIVSGEDRLTIRYVSAILGTLTVLATYLLAHRLFVARTPARRFPGSQPAIGMLDAVPVQERLLPFVAALLLAVLPWHIAFSRVGVEAILMPLWAVLATLYLWTGLQTHRWWDFAISGFFWGSTFYTYQAAFLLPGLLALFLVYKVVQEQGFLRRYGPHLLVLGLAALVTVAPLAEYAYQNPGIVTHRTTQIAVFAKNGDQAPLLSLAQNALKVAGLFVVGGDTSVNDNIPLRRPLPLALSGALVLGLAVALRRVRQAQYGLLILWLAWMLMPSILTDNAPSLRRALGSVPAMVILLALGLTWLAGLVLKWASRSRKWSGLATITTGLAVGVLLIYTGIWGYRYYFVEWASGKDLFHFFDVGLVDIATYGAATPPGTRLYYTPAGAADLIHLAVNWQTRGRDLRTFDGQYGLVLAPPTAQPSLYMITTFQGDTWTLPRLQTLYPSGRLVDEVRNLYGVPHSLAFAIDPGTAPELHIQNQTPTNFENQVKLLGSDLSSDRIKAGETLTVTLYWQATLGPTPLSETVFTHLVGQQNPASGSPVWAGHDQPPLNNSYPTVRWAPGEIIVDRHAFVVPADAPPGVYQVETGLYSTEQGGVRLKVLDSGGAARGDSVMTGTVSVSNDN